MNKSVLSIARDKDGYLVVEFKQDERYHSQKIQIGANSGGVLYRRLPKFPVFYHCGIYLGRGVLNDATNAYDGAQYICSFVNQGDIILQRTDEFSKGYQVYMVDTPESNTTVQDRLQRLSKTVVSFTRVYSLVGRNCVDFCRQIVPDLYDLNDVNKNDLIFLACAFALIILLLLRKK